jgi:hypothetical protein
MSTGPREHTRTYFLGKLAEELEQRGLRAALRRDPPLLKVTGPTASLLSETVDCVALPDGWFYRWSWGDVVASADDPAEAADVIARVLTAAPDPPGPGSPEPGPQGPGHGLSGPGGR